MRHRHLDYDEGTPPAALGLAALDNLLERGDLDDWKPILQAIRSDPWGEVADRVLHLVERRPDNPTATLWRTWIDQARHDGAGPHVGRALRELRLRRGLTQQQVAARLGTVQPEVSKLERRRDTRLSTVRSYVAAVGGRLRMTARFADEDVDLE
jgi:hypothetical protein